MDEYGGLDKAIEIAKQLAKIPADQSIQRVIMPKPPSFFEELMNSGDDGDGDARQCAGEATGGDSRSDAGGCAACFAVRAVAGSVPEWRSDLHAAV